MANQCLTFAQLPEDDAAFLEFLTTTGDVWLRGYNDPARQPQFPPLPITEFLKRYGAKLTNDGYLAVYLGFEQDIVRPPSYSLRYTEGGKRQTTNRVDAQLALLIAYHRGGIMKSGLLALSSIGYRTHTTKKPKEFLSWARRVVGWWEKRLGNGAVVQPHRPRPRHARRQGRQPGWSEARVAPHGEPAMPANCL